jgi:predicted nucleic acid-binding protein
VSGTRFLLDTNFIVGLVKANEQVVGILQDQAIALDSCAYSFITRIELLGYPSITEPEIQAISMLLDAMQ